jgi:hypothetical protein
VFVAYGCAQHWQYHANSKGGTLAIYNLLRFCQQARLDVWWSDVLCEPWHVARASQWHRLTGDCSCGLSTRASAPEAGTRASDLLSTCFFYSRMPDGQWRTRGTTDGAATLTALTLGTSVRHIKTCSSTSLSSPTSAPTSPTLVHNSTLSQRIRILSPFTKCM